MAKKDKKDKKDKKLVKSTGKVDKASKKTTAKKSTSKNPTTEKGTRIITQPCRSSYMFIIEPREDDDGNMVYSSQVLVSKKDKKTLSMINSAIELAAKRKFGEKVKLGQLKLPLRDADSEERDGAEYAGHFFLNCKNFRRPGAVSKSNSKLIGDECPEFLYSGAHFRFSLSFYGFDTRGSKGVGVYLNNVMFHKHGERLDGGVDAEDEFEDYGEDEFDD